MKDYLARYLKEEDEDLKDPGGTALTKLTKPPPEDSFVSFVSAQPLGSPEHGAPQSCPRCGRDLAMSRRSSTAISGATTQAASPTSAGKRSAKEAT